MKRSNVARRVIAAACALSIAFAGIAAPNAVCAEESSSDLEQLQSDVDDLVAKIEETTASYQQAEEAVQAIEEQIAQNESRAAELVEQMPAQRARTAASVREMYIFQQDSSNLLAIILSTESFDDFLATLRYIDFVVEHNTTEINNLANMTDELAQTNSDLQIQRDAALQKQEEAQTALDEARNARAELQARAIAAALSEQGDREAAIAVAQQALAMSDSATFITSSGNTATVQVPSSSSVSTDALLSNITSSENSDWAARINEYLKGSPLEGYGETFAAAAAKYGVDPRLSPAIATIESGKGTYCFRDHNAWGWGNENYSDWETAIDEQVRGLATGYDGTLTLEGAEKYCPPNYQEWYSSVANEMDGI